MRSFQLPRYYAITPDPNTLNRRVFIKKFRQLCVARQGLVLLRATSSSSAEYTLLAKRTAVIAQQVQCRLMLHNRLDMVASLQVAGVHLSQKRAQLYCQRPIDKDFLLAVSCHSLDEVQHADKINADFCVLGPVARTTSHAGRAPLGAKEFSRIVATTQTPVYALGGVSASTSNIYRRRGAYGVAGIRCFWPKSQQ